MLVYDFTSAITWIDLSLGLILGGLLVFVVNYFIKSKVVLGLSILNFLLLVFSWLFQFQFLNTILIIFTTSIVTLTFFLNIGRIRLYLINTEKNRKPFKLFNLSKKKKSEEKVTDAGERQAFYEKVKVCVKALSKQKIGALLTFEKNMLLSESIKTGTVVDAPFSEELVMTIFYPGTRLHDGAIVIRGTQIVAASVYFTPTTKPLSGKFGSRHRAAIGISEISDAVTVVVSEETGRISIAYRGDLKPVTIDSFEKDFVGYMSETLEEAEETK